MSGFIVSYRPPSDSANADRWAARDSSRIKIEIPGAQVKQVVTEDGRTALIDGYALGVSIERLVAKLEAHDDDFLSQVHGNYSVLLIDPSGHMQGFCDRFGAKSLYWQTAADRRVIISSCWNDMPVFERRWDPVGLAEMLRYRWLTGEQTMVAGISKLPHWYRVSFARDGEIDLHDTAQPIQWLQDVAPVTFEDKLKETRAALTGAIENAAISYDKAAILLSGGVDSSLLAALCRERFKECIAVTTVFPGDDNPELEAASTVADQLQLEHLLVEFDDSRLEDDLRQLVRKKGGQINFHSLPIHQMVAAIPDDYQVLIYGEGADSLFGMRSIAKTQTYLDWKRYADLLPSFALKLMSRLPDHRVQRVCHLLQRSTLDVALQHFQIQYEPEAMAVILGLLETDLDEIYAHRATYPMLSTRGLAFRSLLQDIIYRSASANHFRETDLSAWQFGKHVFAPFMDRSVTDAARTLPMDLYSRDGFMKPVVLDLACEHFDRELIYRKKKGFLVPFIAWMKGPLAHLVDAAREERELFDGRLLKDFDIENDFSLFWSLINWQLVNEQLESFRR